MPPSRFSVQGSSPAGQVTSDRLAPNALAATAQGRTVMAPGYLDRSMLDRFDKETFTANFLGRSRFAKGFVDTSLLAPGALSADSEGRAKMAPGYIVTEHLEDASVRPEKLGLEGALYDFTNALALRAGTPGAPGDVVTLDYLTAHTPDTGAPSLPWIYKLLDPIRDVVRGQTNTYYIDHDASPIGWDVQVDENGVPCVRVLRHGLEKLWVAADLLGTDDNPGDFTVVRAVSTGTEGKSPVGSLNALQFLEPITTPTWIAYQRRSPALAVTSFFRRLDLDADKVPGQRLTYYIDKGERPWGGNVAPNHAGLPDIRVIQNGRELLWTPLDRVRNRFAGDFTVVRSLSTGPEGSAPEGWLNALRFAVLPTASVWVHYRQAVPDTRGWRFYRLLDPERDAVPGQASTYYFDLADTEHGHDVLLNPNGSPELHVIRDGRDLLWVPEEDLDVGANPGDFTVVRSLSSGSEGYAAEGSRNALRFAEPLAGTTWVHYRSAGRAQPLPRDGWRHYRQIDLEADAVTGQDNTFYIDRGVSLHGQDVLLDVSGVPELRLIGNGRELLWVEDRLLDDPETTGDFTVTRSLSTGAEGPAAEGSLNAVRLAAAPAGALWLHYRSRGPAGP